MTRILALLLLCALPIGAYAADAPAGQAKPASPAKAASPAKGAVAPNTDEDKVMYSIGAILSGSVKPFALNEKEMLQVQAGFAAGMRGKANAAEIESARPKIQALLGERTAAAMTKSKAAGKAFRDKAAAAKGATTTPSGLVLTTVADGSGASPAPDDEVKVNYEGKLIDGTVFDSSYKRGQPASFKLNGVVPCWTEGLQHMKVGGKMTLVCPPDLAYGDRGAPPSIPGGSTLVFSVELLDVVKAAPAAPAVPAAPAAATTPAAPAAPATPAVPATPAAPAGSK
jgi:FKBP-type peptidyl-prolyl cis-trans isomerase FkpA